MSIVWRAQRDESLRGSAAAASALWVRLLPVVLALLLLALPILCIVHCQVAMQSTHHPRPSASDPRSFFLCELPLPTAAHELFTPAFVPGVLAQIATFAIALALLRPLLLPPATPLVAQHPAPPTPPPR